LAVFFTLWLQFWTRDQPVPSGSRHRRAPPSAVEGARRGAADPLL